MEDPSGLRMHLEPELRAVSDAFLAQLAQVNELEAEKRATPVGAPAFPALARRVEDAVRGLLIRATEQREVAETVHRAAVASDQGPVAIVDVPAALSAAQILRLWRETLRDVENEQRDSERGRALSEMALAYQRAYREAYERLRRGG